MKKSGLNKKVAIIGLDGANKITAQLVGLKKHRIYDFISTLPPYTPPAWTSILTGVNPAKHSIIGWQKVNLKNNTVKLFTSFDVKYQRMSEILDKAHLKSILINLPMTYPFEGIKRKENTIIISDWAAPEQTIFPKKLAKKYKEYLISPPHNWAKYDKRDYLKKVYEYIETRINLYYDLLEREEWNLYFIVFSEIDWISHSFPEVLEGRNVYASSSVFGLISKFIEVSKEIADILIIVSDHGFEVKNRIFYVNEALVKNGFIKYRKIRSRLIDFIKNITPEKMLKKLLFKTRVSASALTYIIRSAKAFMVEPATWGIYVKNKNDVKKVKNILEEYEEISGVVESVRVYDGAYIDHLPQLFVIPNKGVEFSYELKGKIREKTYRGDHEIHGIFSVYGKDIAEAINFKRNPVVYDIAPTIFHIFGLPIPNNMDGRILIEIFKQNSEIYNRKPKYIDLNNYGKFKKDKI